RGLVSWRSSRRAPARVPSGERAAMRFLHTGHALDGTRLAGASAPARSARDPRSARRKLLSLYRLSRDRAGWPRRGGAGAAGRRAERRSAAPAPPRDGLYIGRSIVRRETARLVAGRGTYTDAVAPPHLAHVAFVRSPHAHARIVSIDTRAAAAVPGVIAVVT